MVESPFVENLSYFDVNIRIFMDNFPVLCVFSFLTEVLKNRCLSRRLADNQNYLV